MCYCTSRLFFLYRSPHLCALPSFPTRRSSDLTRDHDRSAAHALSHAHDARRGRGAQARRRLWWNLLSDQAVGRRSEEHTSELQSPCNLVCRLLLEKKKPRKPTNSYRAISQHLR